MLDYSIEFNKADFETVEAALAPPLESEDRLGPKKNNLLPIDGRNYLVTFSYAVPKLGTLTPEQYLRSYRLPWGE